WPARARATSHDRVEARVKYAHLRVVGEFLGASQSQPKDDVFERSEPFPGEVPRRQLEGNRANQLGGLEVGGRVDVDGRCEPESRARGAHLEDLVARAVTEVVRLVDDQELEAGADLR